MAGIKQLWELLSSKYRNDNKPVFPMTNDERSDYNHWLIENNIPLSNDYNMEMFYKASQNPLSGLSSSVNPNDQQIHFPDRFKYPNHPSFSTDSQYYNPLTMPNTPSWQGGPIDNNGNESWYLRKPNGDIVTDETPLKRKR